MPTFLTVDLTLFPEKDRHSPVKGCLSLKGESGILGLCGPSGSGKSTLVRTLAGLIPKGVGQIAMDGRTWLDSAKGIDLPFEQRPVAYLPQEATLFPHMNVQENLQFATLLAESHGTRNQRVSLGNAKKWMGMKEKGAFPEKVLRLVDLFGVGDFLEKKVGALSGGEAMRVSLARCFLKPARLYLLDEPMTGIDPEGRHRLARAIGSLLEERHAMGVWVTHSPEELATLAESMVLLSSEGGDLLIRDDKGPSLFDFKREL